MLEYMPRRSGLTFQVDVSPAHGPLPATLVDVHEREKDFRYSSRTRAATDMLRQVHNVRHSINALWDRLPEALRATPEAKVLHRLAFLLLTLALPVGPLARPDRRFLPLLYNRRRRGALTFVVALSHALEVLDWHVAFSPTPPRSSPCSRLGRAHRQREPSGRRPARHTLGPRTPMS